MTKQRIFAIGDLHLDHTGEKSMEVFGPAWANYEERIFSQWKEKITDHDLVLIPGDISWALKLEEAEPDLRRIDALPGTKLLLRGNHDYWWQSRAKIESLALKKRISYRMTALNGTMPSSTAPGVGSPREVPISPKPTRRYTNVNCNVWHLVSKLFQIGRFVLS